MWRRDEEVLNYVFSGFLTIIIYFLVSAGFGVHSKRKKRTKKETVSRVRQRAFAGEAKLCDLVFETANNKKTHGVIWDMLEPRYTADLGSLGPNLRWELAHLGQIDQIDHYLDHLFPRADRSDRSLSRLSSLSDR